MLFAGLDMLTATRHGIDVLLTKDRLDKVKAWLSWKGVNYYEEIADIKKKVSNEKIYNSKRMEIRTLTGNVIIRIGFTIIFFLM